MIDRVSAEQHIERLRFRRAPLAAAALWFALGISLAHLHAHSTIQVAGSIAMSGFLTVFALLKAPRVALLSVAGLWISLGVAAFDWQPAPSAQTELLAYADQLSRAVRARVLRVHTPPPVDDAGDADTVPEWEAAEDTSEQQGQPMQLDLAIDQVEEVTPDRSTMRPVEGGVRVSVYGASPDFKPNCGDRIEVDLRLKPLERFRTPGAFDYAGYLLQQGIGAHASTSADKIFVRGAAQATLRCRLYAMQAWAAGRLIHLSGSAENQRLPEWGRLSESDALILNAMLFGDRTGLSRNLRAGFERTGTFHLLVVSGLHIALVAAGIFWLLRKARCPAWLATGVTLAGTAAYAALTGLGQPAQRALVMTTVFLLARLLSRESEALNALGASVLAMLVIAPSSLFDASLQMTVLVILAIAGIAIPLARRTPLANASLTQYVFERPRRIHAARGAQLILMLELWGDTIAQLLPRRLTRWTRRLPAHALKLALRTGELTLISLIAELVMLLPMAVYFHRMPVLAVPANLLVLPAIGLLVPLAVTTFAISLLSVKIAVLPGVLTSLLLHGVTWTIYRLGGLSASDVRVPGPMWPVAIAAVAAWLACTWMVRRSRVLAGVAALMLPLVGVCILWPEPTLRTAGSLEITALDVGQGDSILAVNPGGQTMLIDAGGPVGSHGELQAISSFDIGEQVVAPYLWSRQIRRLDILVLSHAHTDHMGGMPAVLADLRPRELWVGVDPDSNLYRQLIAEAGRLKIPVRHLQAGDRRQWGEVEIRVLAPAASYENHSAPKNDDSVVLHLQFDRASVLLEGDAERPSEETMLAAGLIDRVTLLKVGHHGSRTSSNPEFLAAAQPRDAVISVGRHNTFGHPRAEVIDRFEDAHTRLFRTDEFGTTTFLLNADGGIHAAAGSGGVGP